MSFVVCLTQKRVASHWHKSGQRTCYLLELNVLTPDLGHLGSSKYRISGRIALSATKSRSDSHSKRLVHSSSGHEDEHQDKGTADFHPWDTAKGARQRLTYYWGKTKHELLHYKNGFTMLSLNIKTTWSILKQLLQGMAVPSFVLGIYFLRTQDDPS